MQSYEKASKEPKENLFFFDFPPKSITPTRQRQVPFCHPTTQPRITKGFVTDVIDLERKIKLFRVWRWNRYQSLVFFDMSLTNNEIVIDGSISTPVSFTSRNI